MLIHPLHRDTRGGIASVFAIAVIALGVIAATRFLGWNEKAELAVYDHLLRSSASDAADTSGVAVILETEADLQRFNHPLKDDLLAELMERLLAAGITAIGVDKYRDLPVAPGTERLAALLRKHDNIYWVSKFGGNEPGVPPPEVLRGTPQVGCGDVLHDTDGKVRRALIYLDDGTNVCYTLGYVLARHALAAGNVKATFDEAPVALRMGKLVAAPLDGPGGPYAALDPAGFQIPIDYRLAATPLASYSLSDIIDGKVPAEKLKGRVVLFGSSAQSLRDFFVTPLSSTLQPNEIPGVTLHAQIAATLLAAARGSGAGLSFADMATTWMIFIATALFGSTAGFRIRTLRRTIGLVALAMALLYLAAIESMRMGVNWPLMSSCLVLGLATAFAIARRATLERRERTQMMNLFSRHVSKEVALSIWEERDTFMVTGRVTPQTVRITTLFLDIRGFTTVTEKLAPDVMVKWLNRGLTVMTDCIIEHGGVVTRFGGDAIMALYGAPIPRLTDAEIAHDAEQAVRTGLALGQRLDRLNAESSTMDLPSIRIRVGIQSGTVVQGSVGGAERVEFTVLGDAVNTAARLESFVTEDDGATARVLIGAPTHALCGSLFRCELVGSLALKGKDIPVTVYRVYETLAPAKETKATNEEAQ